nr:MAG: hypothetical protein DIU52_07195 [bacterium]
MVNGNTAEQHHAERAHNTRRQVEDVSGLENEPRPAGEHHSGLERAVLAKPLCPRDARRKRREGGHPAARALALRRLLP